MAPLSLEGNSLGKRHKSYNQILNDNINNSNKFELNDINYQEDDVKNLMKVDIASHNKNVDYIIRVLQCADMLYVSRAIKQCTWLLTDPQYSHIINPQYLNEHIFPEMTAKAINKLVLHIRNNLKDESRLEEFFKFYEENDFKKALKWLPSCSVPFIKEIVKKHVKKIGMSEMARLCERSIEILEQYHQNVRSSIEKKNVMIKIAVQYLKSDPDKFLNIFESLDYTYNVRQVHIKHPLLFGKKASEMIVKQHYKRVIDSFDKYAHHIDMVIFAKYLKEEDAKDFILQQADKESYSIRNWYRFEFLQYLVKRIPENERFEFVKQVFIDKIHEKKDGCVPFDFLRRAMQKLCESFCRVEPYKWYVFAPFELAFEKMVSLMEDKSFSNSKSVLYDILFECANNDQNKIKLILQYFHNKHIKDSSELKSEIVRKFVRQTEFYKYDKDTWNYLDNIFKSMDIYLKPETGLDDCVEAIIIYNLTHNQNVPDVIRDKFTFNTLSKYSEKINKEQKTAIFEFVYSYELTKVQSKLITSQKEFDEAVEYVHNLLRALCEWKHNLSDFPIILEKLDQLIILKAEKSWDNNLSKLYNINKSWKKYMFRNSISLNPCEEVCLNVLKHDTVLISHHQSEINKMCLNDSVSLHRLLNKLRIYFPESLAQDWKTIYLEGLNQPKSHKALTRGICTVLSRDEALNLINKYAPTQAKINWNEIDEILLSLQRQFAKNMYIARPQPPPDTVLQYAKGDYLQYALPSLHSIFLNLNYKQCQEHIPKMWNAPVSLQKHGIRLAFKKLKSEELQKAFSEIWNTSKNSTIRLVIFKLTFELLCREKSETKINNLWELLSLFITNLTFKEDNKIYKMLGEVEKVPLTVRAKFLMKSYTFLKSLVQSEGASASKEIDNYKWKITHLAQYTREIMEYMDSNFVAEIILEFIDKEYCNVKLSHNYDDKLPMVSAYVLCAKDEETQIQRFNKVIVPLTKKTFEIWNNTDDDFTIRQNFFAFLQQLQKDLIEYTTKNKMIAPIKIFTDIYKQIENLSASENYVLMCLWKLTVSAAKMYEKYPIKDMEPGKKEHIGEPNESVEICDESVDESDEPDDSDLTQHNESDDSDLTQYKAMIEFGQLCLQQLKEDVKTYFPCIYSLYYKVLRNVISEYPNRARLVIYKCLLTDPEFLPAYLVVISLIEPIKDRNDYGYNHNENEKLREIHTAIRTHHSVEVKMHYFYKFNEEE